MRAMLSRRSFACGLIAATACLALAPRLAAAQEWPARPVTILLPFAGGGMMDFATRMIAQHLTATLGQTFVVEAKSGGGGAIGAMALAKAPPDGYTLMVTAVGPMVFRPLMDKTTAYDADKDFTPIIMIGDTPNAIFASPKLGVGTVKELVAYADKNGKKLNIGHPGVGTMGQFCGALLASKMGIDGNMIAYRGAAPIIVDLLGGQIDIGTPSLGPGSESVKILAVSGEERLDTLPNVPTLKESGLDMECATWLAIYAPAGVPRPIVDKLNAAIDALLRKPETRAKFGTVSLRPIGGPPERLRDRVIADRALWAPIIAKGTGPAK